MGDRSRKFIQIAHGFRLPSALDNRPFHFEEFKSRVNQIVFVSITPAFYEREKCSEVVEQIILLISFVDPEISVRESTYQIVDLIKEIKERAKEMNTS